MSDPSWYPEAKNIRLLTDFILWFSRIEYALKRNAGFSSFERGHFTASWRNFQTVLEQHTIPPEMSAALSYIKREPPMQQDGADIWNAITAPSDWGLLVKALKTVRNNLFHGGKHHTGRVLQPARDRELLLHCITIMKGMALLAPGEVREAFREAE